MVTTTKSYYRVENGDPVLHGHALEHREHGQPDVVEGGDPCACAQVRLEISAANSLIR